jgi:hypothetical protein
MNRKKAVLKPIEVSDADREYLNMVLASNKSPKKYSSTKDSWWILFFMWCNCNTESDI